MKEPKQTDVLIRKLQLGFPVVVDPDGNLVSVEILGPAVFLDLKDLGRYLQEPDSTLRAVADDLTKLGEELEELAGDDGDQ